MSYKSKYGITVIRGGEWDHLEIHWDYHRTPRSKYPVLFFTPDMRDKDEHYHIALTLSQARTLHEWLGDYIEEKEQKRKSS